MNDVKIDILKSHTKIKYNHESIPLKTKNKSTESCVIPAHALLCCSSLSWSFTTSKF